MQEQIACFGCGKDINFMLSEFRRQQKLHISKADADEYVDSLDLSAREKEDLVEFLTESPISNEDALTESGAIRECCRTTILGQQDISSSRIRAAGRPVVGADGKLTIVDIGLYDTPEPKKEVRADAYKAVIPPKIPPALNVLVPIRQYRGKTNENETGFKPLKIKFTKEQSRRLEDLKKPFKEKQQRKAIQIKQEKGVTISTLLQKFTTVGNIHEVKPNLPRFTPGIEVANTKNGYTINISFEMSISTKLVVPPTTEDEDTRENIRAINIIKAIRDFLNKKINERDIDAFKNIKVYEMPISKAYRMLNKFRNSSIPTYAELHDGVTKALDTEENTIIIDAIDEQEYSKNVKLLLDHASKLLKGKEITEKDENKLVINDIVIAFNSKFPIDIIRSPFENDESNSEIIGIPIHDIGIQENKLIILLENLNIIVINDKNATLDDQPLIFL